MRITRRLFHAAMVVDGESVAEAPGALLIDGDDNVIAAGSPQAVGDVSDAEVIDLPNAVVMPALVNVHAHLDLTNLGCWPAPESFLEWVRRVRAERPRVDDAIADAVRRGIELCLDAGVAIVGDIAGAFSRVPGAVMREMGMAGVSFIEVFGNGTNQQPAIDCISQLSREEVSRPERDLELEPPPVRTGIQPHAPYSCSTAVYERAAQTGLPLATHLAETTEEIQFSQSGTGDFATLLREVGAWDGSCTPTQAHPIDLVLDAVGENRPFIAAHVNYLDDGHLERLARSKATVAYCPSASEYFGHPRAGHSGHRYREMIDGGLNVALGTDSIICQSTPGRLSILDEMRMLSRRDSVNPRLLLQMATVNGAAALGFGRDLVTLRPGRKAGILAVDFVAANPRESPLAAILTGTARPRWLASSDFLHGGLRR